MLRKVLVPLQVGENVVCDKKGLKWAMAQQLHRAVDGCGLRSSKTIPMVHKWIDRPSSLMSGANYIGAIQVRGNLMPTAARMARGRPERDFSCDACGRTETLGHVLQICPRTFGPRNKRHNAVLVRLTKMLKKRNWQVTVEPAIPTNAGLRRPDMIVWKDSATCYVIDVTVVADHADLDKAYQSKVERYNTQCVRDWASRVSGTASAAISVVVFNWRGALAVPSFRLMKYDLLFNKESIELLGIIVLEKGFKTWMHHQRSTYRVHGEDERSQYEELMEDG